MRLVTRPRVAMPPRVAATPWSYRQPIALTVASAAPKAHACREVVATQPPAPGAVAKRRYGALQRPPPGWTGCLPLSPARGWLAASGWGVNAQKPPGVPMAKLSLTSAALLKLTQMCGGEQEGSLPRRANVDR